MTVTSDVSCCDKSLDEAMQERMASIVLSERKPFCYFDFLTFEVAGFEYSMTHGTFRNKISKLMKKGEVEVSYRSVQTFKFSSSWFASDVYRRCCPSGCRSAL